MCFPDAFSDRNTFRGRYAHILHITPRTQMRIAPPKRVLSFQSTEASRVRWCSILHASQPPPEAGFRWHLCLPRVLESGLLARQSPAAQVTMDDTPVDHGAPVYLKGSHFNEKARRAGGSLLLVSGLSSLVYNLAATSRHSEP